MNQELIQPLNDSMNEGPLLTEPTATHPHLQMKFRRTHTHTAGTKAQIYNAGKKTFVSDDRTTERTQEKLEPLLESSRSFSSQVSI